jgi:hypothetical protein
LFERGCTWGVGEAGFAVQREWIRSSLEIVLDDNSSVLLTEPKRLQVAGAALAIGPAPSPGQDQAAKSFFEDLLRRGRLKVAKAANPAAEVLRSAAPLTHETHTHDIDGPAWK